MVLLLVAMILVMLIFSLIVHIYGIYLCFKKSPLYGLAALVVPLFPLIIGTAKLIFKKDLLNIK